VNKQVTPPKLFLRFFRWYCHPKMQDYIEGDLMEVYEARKVKNGKWKADVRFIVDVLLLFRPGIIRPLGGSQNLNNYGMYKSYFKIGWRNLVKNKGYSFINIFGLAMGMMVAMLIGLWLHDELNFNRYYKNYNRIGKVIRNITLNDEITSSQYLPLNLGEELKTTYGTTFEEVAMAYPVEDHFLTVGETKLSLRGEFIESNGPELFSLKMVKGSLSGLNDPHSILLSQSVAKILFGEQDPINKLLMINNTMDAKVTGVYEDLPSNTNFNDVKFFAPWDLLTSSETWMKTPSFTNNFMNIYVSLNDQVTFEEATVRVEDAILNNVETDNQYRDVNPQIFLHPMKDWHLWSDWKNGVATGGRAQIVWLFGIVGVFVLVLACINFMNLSTARSENRSKEVGIRKAVGSKRSQLINQFFSESFLVVILAFIASLVFVSTSLSWFNELAGKQMEMPWFNLYFWLASFGFILFTGILAGSYPALYLSSFNTIKVLKGLRMNGVGSLPRKVLVVIQFTVSITLIIGTIVVYQQIQFAKDRPVGYTREGLIMVPIISSELNGKYDLIRTQLKSTGVVVDMAESSSPPTDVWTANGGFDWNGKDPALMPVFATLTVTPEYGKTVGWQFLSGRDFSSEMASDSAAFVINETAAKVLGFDEPVGKIVEWNSWRSKFTRFTILGVVKDMVLTSPYSPQRPAVFFLSPHAHHFINIKIDPQVSTSEALQKIETVFRSIDPASPFDYKFVDQEYALKFMAEERIGKLATVFAVLAILISCLGLFGLASFVAEQRTKEIGIRKVVGASIFSLWKMLSKDFVILVIISSLIAIPIAFYFLSDWLTNYEYRTTISWWIFIMTGAGALLITLVTVSYQAIKAASMNPVKSLRSE
jgi:putative ABC transport system permease protein